MNSTDQTHQRSKKKINTRVEQNDRHETSSGNILTLWCLRILILLGGHRKFIRKSDVSSDEVLSLLGMEEWSEKEINRPAIIKSLKAKLAKTEKKKYQHPSCLYQNITLIQTDLSLNQVESDILAFAVLIHCEEALEECGETLGNIDKGKLIRSLSAILDHDQKEISYALSQKGQLAQSGLLKVDLDWNRDIKNKFNLMDGLADNLVSSQVDASNLFSNCHSKGLRPKLERHDFEHVEKEYSLIQNYLDRGLSEKVEGMNILIYGQPGVGKTEMVRSIVSESGGDLFEISMESNEGQPLSSDQRFSAYQLSQQVLGERKNTAILFDEIEDVFPDLSDDDKQKKSRSEKKAWINKQLETNKAPAFWLSNKVYHIDAAFLRRFDYVLEVRAPYPSIRKKIFGAVPDN